MAPSRRLVRRQPLTERIKAYLSPWDFLLWLSEELETSDWEQWQRDWGTAVGIGTNLVMLIARANSGRRSSSYDDVFADDSMGSGWLTWLATFVVHFLSLLSFINAFYTFARKRHYRLFEASVDAPPSTPSAHRVRVDSSPASSSPLRFLSNMIAIDSAQSRAHPDPQKDVWELSVWDPLPICLRIFCSFSPGHVLVYWLFLPTTPQDMRPSTTVVTTIVMACLLSAQLFMLQSSFSQQSKDTSVIHKEVLNEYDTKYVHPRTQPVMRDVGTQSRGTEKRSKDIEEVDVYKPVTIINKGFHTNPNPNYAKHFDPDGQQVKETPTRITSWNMAQGATPVFRPPVPTRDSTSPVQQRSAMRPPQYRNSMGPGTGDGGSLGVYSHAHSPLKKAASQNFLANQRFGHLQNKPRRESGKF